MPRTALLLIAHGSRRPEANADLEYLAAELRRRGSYSHVQVSFLELAEPTIAAGGEICVREGAEEVVLLPYFLSPGVHAIDDMKDARAALAAAFPEILFRLSPPLGRHPLLVDLVEQRAGEATTP